jgi:outer membrane protein assembly factor BamE (lipoprotein component of BamABCDE complex)
MNWLPPVRSGAADKDRVADPPIKVLAITLVALASTGCSLALMAPVVIDGQAFATERADELRQGMTMTEAQALLGAPLRHRAVKETTVWTYQMRRRLRECRYYLGPIPLHSARTESFGLELVFDSAELESAVYREERPDMKTERILVGNAIGKNRR